MQKLATLALKFRYILPELKKMQIIVEVGCYIYPLPVQLPNLNDLVFENTLKNEKKKETIFKGTKMSIKTYNLSHSYDKNALFF